VNELVEAADDKQLSKTIARYGRVDLLCLDELGCMEVGRGTEEGVQVGPLITDKAREGVAELVDDATQHGARVLTGGKALPGRGHFYAPTVLADVGPEARVLKEEIFGPVAPITTFAKDEEAIALANASEYGLIAYAFTQNLKRALFVAEGLASGMVRLNASVISNPAAPFGGVKASGFGREGGREGIQEFLEVKYVGFGGL
jgi:succinate-semialdehyde dehydrogenase / glutarate-semialdehyde dehydrogenase